MKLFYKILAFATLGATYVTILITFLVAYLSPSKTVLVTINTFGEANIELVFLVLTIPGIYLAFKHLLYEWIGS